MGIIRKTFLTATVGTTAFIGYLHATTSIQYPLSSNDPIWSSKAYRRFNIHRNASTQDIVFRRIPIDEVKPELLQNEGALVRAFCQGVWSGLGYEIQRRYLARKYQDASTSSQLWSKAQLAASNYDVGTQITDHFEVVEKTPTSITVRAGDTPRLTGPRENDGLLVISATIDKEAREVELGLKSCFFQSAQRIEGIAGPMPAWIEFLHAYYSRILVVSGSRRVVK